MIDMRFGSRPCRLALLAGAAIAVASPGPAAVIGHMTPVPGLTDAAVAALPAAERPAWLAYLQRSRAARAVDKATLAAERRGLAAVPAPPPQGRFAEQAQTHGAGWYGSPEARRIADNIVSFQTPTGGWGKNQERDAPRRAPGQSFVIQEHLPANARSDIPGDESWAFVGTIDNDATITEMRFLAQVQQSLPAGAAEPYRRAFLKGVAYLLQAQYPDGGWPQVYPLTGGYHDAVTFNDDAITNVLALLSDVAARQGGFAFVPADTAATARAAVDRALAMIVRAQVTVAERPTGWAQQYDPTTLIPWPARNFEPVALSTTESAALLRFLMRLPARPAAVDAAIKAGVAWLGSIALTGVEWEREPAKGVGRQLVARPGAGPLWARYYSITTMRPVFGDRDRSIHDDVGELSVERRNGYAWFSKAPAGALTAFAKWQRTDP